MGEPILPPTTTAEPDQTVITDQQVMDIPAREAKSEIYIPSSVEKKRAILMYFLLGIITVVGDTRPQTVYERFHLKQAMGWWMIFLFILIISVILLFVPVLRYIPLLVLVGMISILAICIKQANDGKYARDPKHALSLFAGIGEWILGVFEVKQSQ